MRQSSRLLRCAAGGCSASWLLPAARVGTQLDPVGQPSDLPAGLAECTHSEVPPLLLGKRQDCCLVVRAKRLMVQHNHSNRAALSPDSGIGGDHAAVLAELELRCKKPKILANPLSRLHLPTASREERGDSA